MTKKKRNILIGVGLAVLVLGALAPRSRRNGSGRDLVAARREIVAKIQDSVRAQGKTRVTIQATGPDADVLEIGAWNCSGKVLDDLLAPVRDSLRTMGIRRIECVGGSPSRSIE